MIVAVSLAVVMLANGQEPSPAAAPTENAARPAPTDIFSIPPTVREPTEAETADIERLVGEAEAARDAERFDEAIGKAEELAAISVRTYGPRHPITASSRNIAGQVHYIRGDLDAAEAIFREGLEIRRAALGEAHPDVAESLNNLSSIAARRGRHEESLTLVRQAVDVWTAAYGEAHPDVLEGLKNLGWSLYDLGRYGEAEAAFRRADASARALYPDDPRAASAQTALGNALSSLGRFEEAEAAYRRAVAAFVRPGETPDVNAGLALNGLGNIRRLQGDHAEAADLFRRATEVMAAVLGPEHAFVGSTLTHTADELLRMGQTERAEGLLRRALVVREKANGVDHEETQMTRLRLAEALMAQDRPDEAEPLARRAVAGMESALGADHLETARARLVWAAALADTGAFAPALEQGRLSKAAVEARAADDPYRLDAEAQVADLTRRSGEAGSALALVEPVVPVAEARLGPTHPASLSYRLVLAESQIDMGRPAEARRSLTAGGLAGSPVSGGLLDSARRADSLRQASRLKVRAAWMQAAPSA